MDPSASNLAPDTDSTTTSFLNEDLPGGAFSEIRYKHMKLSDGETVKGSTNNRCVRKQCNQSEEINSNEQAPVQIAVRVEERPRLTPEPRLTFILGPDSNVNRHPLQTI